MSENVTRVLQVVTKMSAGGIETLIMNFYRKMDRNKIQFDFLVHREEQAFYDPEIIKMGGRIFYVPAFHPLSTRHYKKSLEVFFHSTNEYKIIHSHINSLSMYPLKAAAEAGIPVRIAHSHIAYPKFDRKTPFKLLPRLLLKNYYTHAFACSKLAGNWLFGKKARFEVINNSIMVKHFKYNPLTREDKRKEMDLEGKFVIGHIGRFSKQKNHKFLLEIFQFVKQYKANAFLLLIGSGEQEEAIKRIIIDYKLIQDVKILGERSDIADFLQAMDVFVLPSLFEGLPLTLIEAQASGLPCIVSDNVTIESRVTDLVNFLPLSLKPKDWAGQILNFDNWERIDVSQEIVAKGFDICENAQKLQEFYLEQDRISRFEHG